MGLLGSMVEKVRDALTGPTGLVFARVQGENPAEVIFRASSGGFEFFVRQEPGDPTWFTLVQDADGAPVDVETGFASQAAAEDWCRQWT